MLCVLLQAESQRAGPQRSQKRSTMDAGGTLEDQRTPIIQVHVMLMLIKCRHWHWAAAAAAPQQQEGPVPAPRPGAPRGALLQRCGGLHARHAQRLRHSAGLGCCLHRSRCRPQVCTRMLMSLQSVKVVSRGRKPPCATPWHCSRAVQRPEAYSIALASSPCAAWLPAFHSS